MAGQNPCDLYTQIDSLDHVRSVPELVAKLKPILSALAYHAVNGETAVSDYHEQWRTQYANHLYAETSADHSARRAATSEAKAPGGPSEGPPARAPAAMPRRPRPNAVPPSLQAIMNGSHPSLREED